MTEPELRLRCFDAVAKLVKPEDRRYIAVSSALDEAEKVYQWCTKNRQQISLVGCPVPKE